MAEANGRTIGSITTRPLAPAVASPVGCRGYLQCGYTNLQKKTSIRPSIVLSSRSASSQCGSQEAEALAQVTQLEFGSTRRAAAATFTCIYNLQHCRGYM
jgi:hypothetical protein